MIEARNGFRDRSANGVGSSLSLLSTRLIGAVTAVGLVRPLSEWDSRDSVPSHGREGYVVSPKSGKRVADIVGGRVEPIPSPWDGQCLPGEVGGRGVDVFVLDVDVVGGEDGLVPRILRKDSFPIPWVPRTGGIVGVVNGVRRRSITPWVCCVLGTPYVPRRGTWVLNWGCRGATSVELLGIVSGRELLPTQVVLVGGGIPNRDRSPVKGTGGGCCANRCQVRAYCRLSSLESGNDIVCGEWGESEVGSWESPSSKESQSLQVSADLLCVYEREDWDGGEGGCNGDGYA